MSEKIIQQIKKEKIIAIVRGCNGDECVKLAQALYKGGIRLMEITFDQQHPERDIETAKTIYRLLEMYGDSMSFGAGTVMTRKQVQMVRDAGGFYIISANTDPDIICYTKELNMVSLPGAMSPTEIASAYQAGADFVKVFPAGILGAKYIKALSEGPYPHIPLLAVGGISEKNAGEFLAAGAQGLGIGGMLSKRELVKEGRFEEIQRTARAMVKACHLEPSGE